MKNAQKPAHITLTGLVNKLREGRYVIPDFQREFEWKPKDISALMRSIFLDYYIGSLLLWKGSARNFDALACEQLHGFRGDDDRSHIVLDGQQRLTAMYYAFFAPDVSLPGRKNPFLYFIRVDRFMDEAYDDAFYYDWTQRGQNLLDDPIAQFDAHMFPLAVVGKGGWELGNWIQGYDGYWKSKEDEAKESGNMEQAGLASRHAAMGREFGKHLKDITDEFQVAYIELDGDLELDKVCDIFTQINSRGMRLDIFDLINALLRPMGVRLKELWRNAEPSLEFVEAERMNVYVLQVMSILRQAYCSPKYLYYLLPGQHKKVREPDGSLRKQVLVSDVTEFTRLWHEAVHGIEDAIKRLRHPQDYGAISSRYLPYVSILPAFAAAQIAARALPANRQLGAQRKIRRWYWASVFTYRYSGSVESTSARDFLDLKDWFDDEASEPALIAEFEDRFRSLDLRRETRRGYAVYNGIFNLFVLNGARDWMTGAAPQYDDLDDHHIVPKKWGQENAPESSIDTILNRAPLTAGTNRGAIGERLPNQYLPALIKENGEAAVRAALESHFISPAAFDVLLRDPFTAADYEDFLAERERTISHGIEDLLVKERLDLSPRLRELDVQVESVELRLRGLVRDVLTDGNAALPSHVAQNIEKRIQSKVKKSAITGEQYSTLEGRLEYADLRELEGIVTNRGLNPMFASRFGTNEMLAKRFDQLAELRNAIRHTRTVDEVTRLDGEAAVRWFQQILGA